ncbi:MAG: ATP-binding cassette domain-containing protein [Gammaproteobacteria bacterium]|jgi:ABC-2 type transport system ATP-binding protein|nr:ATP-binding cassette domain-containing protein [Gammaproteobacteria bacterium]
MIEARALTRYFDRLLAVDNISFKVELGEVLGFLGPNGAGKSTAMKMLTGFLAPSSGNAVINGHDIVTDSLRARQEIGYLPEGAPLYGEMTVTDFLQFIAKARGFTGHDARHKAAAAAERLELGSVLQQSIETLSKGFKRRVGLAQAILHDPRVLILDEPTDGLDPNQKHHVRELISSMSENRIIIVSTHILEEVDALCNRAMIIARGRVVADDTPAGLIGRSRYHNAVTLKMAELRSAASILSKLPGVARVEINDDELTLFPHDQAQLLSAVTASIEKHGWSVDSIRLEEGRLDEVFREITRSSVPDRTATDVKEVA